jgi:hypothetical protein
MSGYGKSNPTASLFQKMKVGAMGLFTGLLFVTIGCYYLKINHYTNFK